MNAPVTIESYLSQDRDQLNQIGKVLFEHAAKLEKEYRASADPDEKDLLKTRLFSFYMQIPKGTTHYFAALKARTTFLYDNWIKTRGESPREAYQRVKSLVHEAKEAINPLEMGYAPRSREKKAKKPARSCTLC